MSVEGHQLDCGLQEPTVKSFGNGGGFTIYNSGSDSGHLEEKEHVSGSEHLRKDLNSYVCENERQTRQ